MSLANLLGEAGHEARSIQTSARARLEQVGDAFNITLIELSTTADVPGLEARTLCRDRPRRQGLHRVTGARRHRDHFRRLARGRRLTAGPGMTDMPTAVQVVVAGSPGPALGRHTGFDALEQALIECAGSESRTVGADEEEVLFVLSGAGELELAGERHAPRTRGRCAPAGRGALPAALRWHRAAAPGLGAHPRL